MKKVHAGRYEETITVRLTKDGVTTEHKMLLTIQDKFESGDCDDPVWRWDWELECEEIDFYERGQDSGYKTKAWCMSEFATPDKMLRNWRWFDQCNCWCV